MSYSTTSSGYQFISCYLMNINRLFIKIFNNSLLARLIIQYVKYIHQTIKPKSFGGKNEENKPIQVYSYNEMMESPFIMTGNGYLELLKEYLYRLEYPMTGNSVTTRLGQTVFGCAALVGRVDLLEWLQENRPQDRKWATLYHCAIIAAFNDQLEIAQWLVETYTESLNKGVLEKIIEFDQNKTIEWIKENKIRE
ncbi:hypothetical protein PPL_11500 [Heterostelium album PN500]|uniref:Ankyrin repeat protein n=1 Tax=Heterostelium pallidum (strain ATCC 26659 / Pp 5 / PN500) TaxID=670386 RepID=D3BTK3_HETP5|nr:hypothetical protein PPL_11500 [Heterostelium album PN500]EFA75420.1 hypothetical protein PPL_11500 [Heterostelium album PN500]|eukprot:XP_020427554.1 hypothetical protein PPL_11500 [Heterostelium album PN500]